MAADTEISYVAGFFDGEGCISIAKNGAVDVRITNTSKAVLVKIQTWFGGSINNRTQKVNKTQYVYSLYGDEAIEFLTILKPYLIEKAPQVDTITEYYQLRKDIKPIRIPGKRGAFSNPDRDILVQVFRDILSEQKLEEN
jgi:hypothetical protein